MKLMLKQLRKSSGITQTELANRIGTTMRVVSAWERGETSLPFEDAALIADVLGCSLDELAGRRWAGRYSDIRQELMNEDYSALSEAGKDAAAGAVKGIKINEGARGAAPGVPAVAV